VTRREENIQELLNRIEDKQLSPLELERACASSWSPKKTLPAERAMKLLRLPVIGAAAVLISKVQLRPRIPIAAALSSPSTARLSSPGASAPAAGPDLASLVDKSPPHASSRF